MSTRIPPISSGQPINVPGNEPEKSAKALKSEHLYENLHSSERVSELGKALLLTIFSGVVFGLLFSESLRNRWVQVWTGKRPVIENIFFQRKLEKMEESLREAYDESTALEYQFLIFTKGNPSKGLEWIKKLMLEEIKRYGSSPLRLEMIDRNAIINKITEDINKSRDVQSNFPTDEEIEDAKYLLEKWALMDQDSESPYKISEENIQEQ